MLISQYVEFNIIEQAINLVPSYTGEKWYQNLLKTASAICLPNHRIEFLLDGKFQTAPRMASTFFYFGMNKDNEFKFCELFQKFGFVRPI